HGVMSLNSEATPTIGRLKSSSWKPTARSMARLGARPGPSVVRRLVRLPSDGMERPSGVSRATREWGLVTVAAAPGGGNRRGVWLSVFAVRAAHGASLRAE